MAIGMGMATEPKARLLGLLVGPVQGVGVEAEMAEKAMSSPSDCGSSKVKRKNASRSSFMMWGWKYKRFAQQPIYSP